MDIEKKEIDDSRPESLYTPAFQLSDELVSSVEAAPRGEETTYGATPFDKLVSLANQEEVLSNRQTLVQHIPDNIPILVANYVQETFNNRFWARLAANDENFTTRLMHKDLLEADPRLHRMIDLGRFGKASPAELMLIRDQLGIRSLEVACLTHPYGEGIKAQLPVMRQSVKKAVEIFGGTYDEYPKPRYGMKEVLRDESGRPVAILMTRKKDVGTLPDGHGGDGSIVRERSSFIMRIDDMSELRDIYGDQRIDKFVAIASKGKEEQQKLLEEFNDTISIFLDSNEFTEAIPIATTTYVFDRNTTKLVEESLRQSPKPETEQEFFAHPVDEGRANEVQERLDRIVKAYQHDVYKSVKFSDDDK
ncbi:MAG: hypothetical protein JWO99_289 [Candidatus Saccharibacteria bacterium]|nr:hypothetical protein [Candidatus Saccharibacteria bacterium]